MKKMKKLLSLLLALVMVLGMVCTTALAEESDEPAACDQCGKVHEGDCPIEDIEPEDKEEPEAEDEDTDTEGEGEEEVKTEDMEKVETDTEPEVKDDTQAPAKTPAKTAAAADVEEDEDEDGEEPSEAERLRAAIKAGETEFTLAGDVTVEGLLAVEGNFTLDLNGYTFTVGSFQSYDSDLTITNGTIVRGSRVVNGTTTNAPVVVLNFSGEKRSVLFENVTIQNEREEHESNLSIDIEGISGRYDVSFEGCDIYGPVFFSKSDVLLRDCGISLASYYPEHYNTETVVQLDLMNSDVTIVGGEYVGCRNNPLLNEVRPGAGSRNSTLVVKSGTFKDVSGVSEFVPDTFTVTEDGDTVTVSGPAAPELADLESVKVTVKCINEARNPYGHKDPTGKKQLIEESFALQEDTYTLEANEDDGYTITVEAEKYVELLSSRTARKHMAASGSASATLVLDEEGKWVLAEDGNLVFEAVCPAYISPSVKSAPKVGVRVECQDVAWPKHGLEYPAVEEGQLFRYGPKMQANDGTDNSFDVERYPFMFTLKETVEDLQNRFIKNSYNGLLQYPPYDTHLEHRHMLCAKATGLSVTCYWDAQERVWVRDSDECLVIPVRQEAKAIQVILTDGTTEDYDGLAEAVAAVEAGGARIVLRDDVVLTETLSIGKDMTLDLNGKTLIGNDLNAPAIKVTNDATLTLDGDGTISGFAPGGEGHDHEGTITLEGGSFIMESGTITDNHANYGGGGVFIKGGTFTMNGGAITGNTAGAYGGGVYVYNYNGDPENVWVAHITSQFIMSGGEISGNTAKYGGGVAVLSYMNDAGQQKSNGFVFKGGSVEGNTATVKGGGIYAEGAGGCVDIRKEAVVSGNNAPDGSGICARLEAEGTLKGNGFQDEYYLERQGKFTVDKEVDVKAPEGYAVVKTDNGDGTFTYTLSKPAEGEELTVTLNQKTAALYSNGTPNTVTLTATVNVENAVVTWTSSDESVATVDANGVVTAVADGTATITAAVGGVSDTCEVTVTRQSTSGGGGGGSTGGGTTVTPSTPPEVEVEEPDVPLAELPLPFVDVKNGDWYRESVAFMYKNDLMMGVSDNLFGVNTNTTRGMMATVIYRLEKEPSVTFAKEFSDVDNGKWFSLPVTWANANKVAVGYDNGKFGPDDNVTREQLVSMLYRYASQKGFDVSGKADLSKFADAGKVSGYAKDAMSWAVSEGIIVGRSENTLAPTAMALRVEVASIFQRFAARYMTETFA